MSFRHNLATTLAAAVALAALSGLTMAQDAETVDVTKLTCRDYLLMDGDARDNTALFLHGYVSGKRGEATVKIPDIGAATDKVLESCIDKPDGGLLEMFEAARS